MSLCAIDRAEGWPDGADWDATIEGAARAALRVSALDWLLADNLPVEISVRLTDDAEMRALNRDYRGKDKPTNVLSFPQMEADELDLESVQACPEILLGDIVLAYETCAREAQERAISVSDHVAHLIAHGTLHLIGYDHLVDDEAEAMEALETKALASLGLANPYRGDAPIMTRG